MDYALELVCWNVRGLNDPAKRSAIREFVEALRVSIVCFQETKMDVLDDFLVRQCLEPSFDGYVYLVAVETRGGILLAWDSSMVEISRVTFYTHAITGEVHMRENTTWWLTMVYGPQSAKEKLGFLAELAGRRELFPRPWMVAVDFNMILHANEKSNNNLDRGMMSRFRSFVQQQELTDTYLHGRLYTWSNERDPPTLSRIDKMIALFDWKLQHPDDVLQALSSLVSDHAPTRLSLSAMFNQRGDSDSSCTGQN
jgi:exonuclease III